MCISQNGLSIPRNLCKNEHLPNMCVREVCKQRICNKTYNMNVNTGVSNYLCNYVCNFCFSNLCVCNCDDRRKDDVSNCCCASTNHARKTKKGTLKTGYDNSNDNSKILNVCVDTGSCISVITRNLIDKYKLHDKLEECSPLKVRQTSGYLNLRYRCNLLLQVKDIARHITCYVSDASLPYLILGLNDCRKFNLVIDCQNGTIRQNGQSLDVQTSWNELAQLHLSLENTQRHIETNITDERILKVIIVVLYLHKYFIIKIISKMLFLMTVAETLLRKSNIIKLKIMFHKKLIVMLAIVKEITLFLRMALEYYLQKHKEFFQNYKIRHVE